jgi:hypothetical protein
MVIVYIVLVLLVVAVCVLFAMIGELAGQTGRWSTTAGTRRSGLPETAAEPIADANVGKSLSSLPSHVMRASDTDDVGFGGWDIGHSSTAGMLVISSICVSCTEFARDWAASPHSMKLPTPMFVVVAARDVGDAERFSTETGLPRITNVTLLFDPLGAWCRDELHVNSSPAFLTITGGVIAAAWRVSSFTQIPSLWHTTQRVEAENADKSDA